MIFVYSSQIKVLISCFRELIFIVVSKKKKSRKRQIEKGHNHQHQLSCLMTSTMTEEIVWL